MFRLSSLFAAIAFTAWILPLGFFIKPSQEKTACDGKRAVHMCSLMKGMVQKTSPGVSLSSASGAEKSAKASSGSGSDDYLIRNRKIIFSNSRTHYPAVLFSVPFNPALYRLDAVPKF